MDVTGDDFDGLGVIVETNYDDETKTLTAAIDFPFQTLQALFGRQGDAATANGLS